MRASLVSSDWSVLLGIKMDCISLVLCGLALLLAVYILFPRTEESKRFNKQLDKLGLLPPYPIIGSVAPAIFTAQNHMLHLLGYYFKTRGPIVTVWMGSFQVEVLTCLPEVSEALLSNPKHIKKGHTYDFLQPWLGTGLLTAAGGKWHSRRKIITPTFHFSILESFLEVFSRNAAILVKQLKKEANCGTFDVFPYVTKCTLDIICESAMGVTVRTQEGENPKYIASIYELSQKLIYRRFRPWLYPDLLFSLSPSGRRFNQCLRELHGFTDKVIAERKATRKQGGPADTAPEESDGIGKKTRKAFLDMLLDASESGVNLTDRDIREEVDTFMFERFNIGHISASVAKTGHIAEYKTLGESKFVFSTWTSIAGAPENYKEGHDTTTAAICWALYLLGSHPDIQEKVYSEVEEIFGGSDRPATLRDLQEMKYLERVIKETLRLYPSVPVVERELREDLVIDDDITIPAGVDVALFIYYLHRDPAHFPNPEHFDPDNFLPERVSKRHPYAYVPFSAGPRNCIGQKFAMLEEKMILSNLIRNYKFQTKKERNGISISTDLILRPDNGIIVSISPRPHQDSTSEF